MSTLILVAQGESGGGGGGNSSTVSVSTFTSDQSDLDYQSSGFRVSDTAVNISIVIDTQNNDPNVIAIA
jgi:hypothetical protein